MFMHAMEELKYSNDPEKLRLATVLLNPVMDKVYATYVYVY